VVSPPFALSCYFQVEKNAFPTLTKRRNGLLFFPRISACWRGLSPTLFPPPTSTQLFSLSRIRGVFILKEVYLPSFFFLSPRRAFFSWIFCCVMYPPLSSPPSETHQVYKEDKFPDSCAPPSTLASLSPPFLWSA